MRRPRYVILGAGISGLALGWYLKQRHHEEIELSILEASNRSGGWIRTEIKNDFLFEQGPHSFRPQTCVETLQLIESLGLQDEVIFADPAARKRYLYINRRLYKLPTGPLSLLFSPLTAKFMKALWNDWYAPKGLLEDESVYSFAKRRFGIPFTQLFFDPLISGIYAGDIKELSLKSCFPWLHHLEQNYRCIWRGAFADKNQEKPNTSLTPFMKRALHNGIFTLKSGMQSLTDKLSEKMKSELHLNSPVTRLTFADGHSVIELAEGKKIFADRLFLAIPPKDLAHLFPAYPVLTQKLQAIPANSLAIINLGYQSSVLKYSGFGHLIPSQEKQKLLGVVWDSSAFPQQNAHKHQTRLTAMLGGSHFGDLEAQSDGMLIETALNELSEQLKILEPPDCICIKRAYSAIPQYTIGHQNRIDEIETEIKKLPAQVEILGNGYYGISIDDCIFQAHKRAFIN